MKKFFVLIVLILVWGFWAPLTGYVLAEDSVISIGRTARIEDWNQKVYINKDSTIDVIQKTTFKLTGTFHTFYTKYAILNAENEILCSSDITKQCASPELFQITAVQDIEGNDLSSSVYSVSEESDENGSLFKVVTYNFGEAGRVFNNQTFGIIIKYKIYGGVGNDPSMNIDYIYLSNIPTYDIKADKITIQNYFPEGFEYNPQLFKVYQPLNGASVDYKKQYYASERMVEITLEDFMTNYNFTYQIGFPVGVVDQPAVLNIATSVPASVIVEFNGMMLDTGAGQKIEGLPTGSIQFKFSAYGYNDRVYPLEIASGETKTINVELEETIFTKLMKFLFIALNAIGILLIPTFLFLVYRHWNQKGRDMQKVKVVVPYYHPPEDIRPYLLGSIKDEQVDVIDITSTLIDTAYRGYIKIKELPGTKLLGFEVGGKDYELTKIKDFDDLKDNEKEIMNGIFDYKDRTTISALTNKFYTKVPAIRAGIYREMRDIGYFKSRPDETRRNYMALGFVVLLVGILSFCGNGLVISIFIYPLFFSLSVAIGIAGLALMVVAPFMPSRTLHGSKVYEQLLGFKMYMDVAERFRVQDLTPDTFEKYLPYAMVFGIEKKWGERFKDICKVPPKWFEGKVDTWNTIYLINALNTFNTATVSALTSVPSSSGKGGMSWGSRGGGWSGGGGFSGGFSGGGIGGGSHGGFT